MEYRSFTQNSGFNSDQQANVDKPQKPNNHIALAIVGVISGFCSPCCIGLILGIISIVFSTQVDTKYNNDDFYGAADSSRNAKLLATIAIVLGVIGLIYAIIQFASMGFEGYMSKYEEILSTYSN